MQSILQNEEFDIDKHFYLIRSKKDEIQYSTPYTMVNLNYNTDDVVERLKELTIEEYSETIIDKDDPNPPLLYVFGKEINRKQVYIKLKIKNTETKKVLCVSFHYAKHKMPLPYVT